MQRRRKQRLPSGIPAFRRELGKRFVKSSSLSEVERLISVSGWMQDYLAGKLGLENKRRNIVRQLIANHLALSVASARALHRETHSVGGIKKFTRFFLKQLPGYLSSQRELSRERRDLLLSFRENLQNTLRLLKGFPDNSRIPFDSETLELMERVNEETLKKELGKKYKAYSAMVEWGLSEVKKTMRLKNKVEI